MSVALATRGLGKRYGRWWALSDCSLELLATHRRLSGTRRDSSPLPARQQVVEERHAARQRTLLVRTEEPMIDPAWSVEQVGLEDSVLAYMSRAAADAPPARVGQ